MLADACPVVGIIGKIAKEHNVPVTLLCDTNHVLSSDYSEVIVVGAGADALIGGYPLRIEGGDFKICDGQNSNCGLGGCYKQEIYQKYALEKGEGMMRIAVTYENGQIFQHFGHTEAFKIYDVEEGKVVHSEVVDTNGSGHGALAGVLNALNVDILICGGIGGGAQTALAAAGIKLFGGVSGDADEAVNALINETLDYNPEVKCSHHEHNHEEGHACGEHGCGSHSCH